MARPLREGTLGEPPAPLPSHPSSCGGGGGGGAPARGPPPTARGSRPSPSGARPSCGNRGDPPGTPQSLGVYGWGQHGDFPPTEDPENEGTPQILEGTPQIFGGGAVANGHLPGPPQNPEQILGARLRILGDAFQHSYERQRRGLFWGPLLRWVAPWLGAAPAAPLAARGGN